jgi:DNA-binding Lrp family transcriptional regulator
MSRFTEKKLEDYHRIYEELYREPTESVQKIAQNTGIPKNTVSRYLAEMYESSVLRGPAIFLKPAENYYQYVYFLAVKDPLSAYERFAGSHNVISVSVECGQWNSLVISEKVVDFSGLKGSEKCILQGRKGVTSLSKVTCLDWDQSLESISSVLSPPPKKSMLYEEIPVINWTTKEWTLYEKFKHNVRAEAEPILKECEISYDQYQKWLAELPEVAVIQPAFYPEGLDNYSLIDFLFRSQYEEQLTTVLGMLPSTSVFFCVGDYLFARLSVPNKREKNLISLISKLKEKGYFTEYHQSTAVLTSGDSNGQKARQKTKRLLQNL